jgi:L-lactate dehydrogenase
MIDDTPLDKALPPTALNRNDVYNECTNRTQTIIHGKGTMPLGIGSLIANICQAIKSENGKVCLISQFQPKWGCCFSSPAVLGKAGIIKTLEISLSSSEWRALEESARELKAKLAKIYEAQ